MEEQNYTNHAKFVPLYHGVLSGLLLLAFLGSLLNLYWRFTKPPHVGRFSAELITLITVAMLIQFLLSRVFPLKAQDRAIRAEENLRHFVLTGKLLDPRLGVKQIVALRFASDGEFEELARRAAAENFSPDTIKKSVRVWRADHYRL